MKKKLLISLFLFLFLIIIVLIYPNKVQAVNPDSIMSGADNFLNIGDTSLAMDYSQLDEASDFIYNILLGISLVIAVVVGMFLGIKFMVASSEEKAEIKESLVPYVISCVVIFGAFTIWKLIINIIQ